MGFSLFFLALFSLQAIVSQRAYILLRPYLRVVTGTWATPRHGGVLFVVMVGICHATFAVGTANAYGINLRNWWARVVWIGFYQ